MQFDIQISGLSEKRQSESKPLMLMALPHILDWQLGVASRLAGKVFRIFEKLAGQGGEKFLSVHSRCAGMVLI
jgi:hypothetical protein